MADKRIDEVAADIDVTGSEKIPVDDGGVAKFVTVEQVKDSVLAKIAALAAASGITIDDDSVFILRGGSLTRVTASTFAAAVMNEAFGRSAVAEPNGNEVLVVKDSTVRKTITFTALKEWLEDNMTVTPDLTLADAESAGTLGDSDVALVVQAAAGKKVTLATLKDYVLNKLAAFVAAQGAAQTVSSGDMLLLVQGGNVRKVTVAQLSVGNGDVKGPANTTDGNIPQWDSAAKTLKNGFAVTSTVNASSTSSQVPTAAAVHAALDLKGDVKKSGAPTSGLAKWNAEGKVEAGPAVATSVRSAASASDDAIPTEKAVRQAIADASGVTPPELPVQGNVPLWGSGGALTAGKAVRESIRDTANASHDAFPTEKAVRDAMDGMVAMPASHTEDAIPTWGSGSELKAGLTVVPSGTGIASADNASDTKIPTEKAVREAIPGPATNASAGTMSAADKAKLDNMVDTASVQEIGEPGIADSDMITVLQGGTTWKKSLVTRLWTWLMSKLTTYKIDDLAAGDDNTDLDASAARHGLCPKLPNDATKFLRGDGTFATPTGSTDFTGDSGSGGAHGLVPAPASGDAASNKFLNASGAWAVPPSAAGVDIPGSAEIDAAAAADALICWDASANAYRKMTLAQVTALVLGTKRYGTIFIPAGAMMPGATTPATAGSITFTNAKHDTMAFNATASQTAEFDLVLPDGWDGGGLKAKFLWTAYDSTKAEQGEAVKWQIGCKATPDEGAITVVPTAWADKTDTLSQVNELHRTTATAAFTPEGTIEPGGLLHFTVKRDNAEGAVSGAPLDTDALLLGVLIQYGKTEDTAQW